jgi:putative membrane protein
MSAIGRLISSVATAVLAVGIATAALAVDALPDAQFVGFIQQANDFELDSSRLALQRSESEAIRAYAKRMTAERGEIALLLSKARSEARVGYVPTSSSVRPRHTAVLDRLHTLEGTEFDKAYASAQLAAQIEIVDQVEAYGRDGGNADLRRFAEQALPRLQAELEHARRIVSLTNPSASERSLPFPAAPLPKE